MAKIKKSKSPIPYAQRLLEDEYVQEQLRHAATSLRAAYDRVRRQRGQATEDKRLYGNLRQAATSIRKVAVALQRPKPKPKRWRVAKVAILAFAIGATAWLTLKLQKQQADANQPGATAATRVDTDVAGPRGPRSAAEADQSAAAAPPLD